MAIVGTLRPRTTAMMFVALDKQATKGLRTLTRSEQSGSLTKREFEALQCEPPKQFGQAFLRLQARKYDIVTQIDQLTYHADQALSLAKTLSEIEADEQIESGKEVDRMQTQTEAVRAARQARAGIAVLRSEIHGSVINVLNTTRDDFVQQANTELSNRESELHHQLESTATHAEIKLDDAVLRLKAATTLAAMLKRTDNQFGLEGLAKVSNAKSYYALQGELCLLDSARGSTRSSEQIKTRIKAFSKSWTKVYAKHHHAGNKLVADTLNELSGNPQIQSVQAAIESTHAQLSALAKRLDPSALEGNDMFDATHEFFSASLTSADPLAEHPDHSEAHPSRPKTDRNQYDLGDNHTPKAVSASDLRA